MAADSGHVAGVRLLLAAGADQTIEVYDEAVGLCPAASLAENGGHTEIIALLLPGPPAPPARRSKAAVAVSKGLLAAEAGDLDGVRAALAAGADPSAAEKREGRTAPVLAGTEAVALALLDAGQGHSK